MSHSSASQTDTEIVFNPETYLQGVPYDTLKRLRQKEGVVWVEEPPVLNYPEGPGFWLVLRYRDVEQVLRNPQLFSSWLGATQTRDPATAKDLAYVRQMMLNMDPPEHTRLRRLLQQSFTSRAIAQLEDKIRSHAQQIVNRVTADTEEGVCDFVKDIATDLPLLTLADLLGMPQQDCMLLGDWANRVIGFQDPEYAVSSRFDPSQGTAIAREALKHRPKPDKKGQMPNPRTREGILDLYTYAHLLAEEKRCHPGDDIMSILLAQVDEAGGKVSIEEFENLFWLFSVAGNETLRNGIPGGMIALLNSPQTQEDLHNDLSLLDSTIDEMLRWWTPVMTFRRTARADCEVGGVAIKAGEKVVVSFASANRDDTVFSHPDQFDIHRHPNPHLTFGYGPHFCLGAHLARVQMQALFREVLSQMGQFRYAGEVSYLCSNFQRGVKRLPIHWRKSESQSIASNH